MIHGGTNRELGGGFPLSGDLVGEGAMAAGNEADQRFERIKAQLRARLGSEVYSSWFGRMKLVELSKGVARMSVPTAFLRSWINGHYSDVIAELWKQEDASILKIEVVVRSATRHASPDLEAAPVRKVAKQSQAALSSGTVLGAGKQERAPMARGVAADFSVFGLGREPNGPPLSMARHYRNRCGKGKAASNGFLTNLVTIGGHLSVFAGASTGKAVVIQTLFRRI